MLSGVRLNNVIGAIDGLVVCCLMPCLKFCWDLKYALVLGADWAWPVHNLMGGSSLPTPLSAKNCVPGKEARIAMEAHFPL